MSPVVYHQITSKYVSMCSWLGECLVIPFRNMRLFCSFGSEEKCEIPSEVFPHHCDGGTDEAKFRKCNACL